MSYYNYQKGLGNVGSYLVSGIPFATSSVVAPASGSTPIKIEFPSVTSKITVKNTLSTASTAVIIKVGFSENGVQGTNYFELSNQESFSESLRVKEIYVISSDSNTATFQVLAGCTGIEKDELPTNWSGSSGVG